MTGISPDQKWVSYNDPTLGEQTITAEEFNRLWGLQGNSGVAVRKTVLASETDLVPWVAFAATLMAIISQTPLALRRMGIGGRLIAAGGGSTRKKTIRPRTSRAPKTVIRRVTSRVSRAIPRSRRPTQKPKPKPQPDPSPQMSNTAPPLSSQHLRDKLADDTPVTPPERQEYEEHLEYQKDLDEAEYSMYLQYLKGLEYSAKVKHEKEVEEFERNERLARAAREAERQGYSEYKRKKHELDEAEYSMYVQNLIDLEYAAESKEQEELEEFERNQRLALEASKGRCSISADRTT